MSKPDIRVFNVDNFSKALQDDEKYFVVYFSAPWCQPCKSTRPVFIKFANENIVNNVIFGEIDIAISPTIAQTYGIKSVPLIAVFHKNQIIKSIPGEISLNQLRQITEIFTQTGC